MIGFIKKLKLWKDQRGAVAAMIAVGLTFMVGFTSMAVDLGVIYTAKAELQNAADAAALGAANAMISTEGGVTTATPDVALQTARNLALANTALGKQLSLLDQDFTIGYWDAATANFDPNRTGFSSDPSDLTAVRVTVRRDDVANTPVSTFFAGILGIDTVNVRATSTAYLGFPSGTPYDTVDLPFVLKDKAIKPGDDPKCGDEIIISKTADETAEWTTFHRTPVTSHTVDWYVCDCYDTPELAEGETIKVVTESITKTVFYHLRRSFKSRRVNGEWTVTLPVVSSEDSEGPSRSEVIGFVRYTITNVDVRNQRVEGYLSCGGVVPGSHGGGKNFGSRAANAVLIR